jgi:hypothetical protein
MFSLRRSSPAQDLQSASTGCDAAPSHSHVVCLDSRENRFCLSAIIPPTAAAAVGRVTFSSRRDSHNLGETWQIITSDQAHSPTSFGSTARLYSRNPQALMSSSSREARSTGYSQTLPERKSRLAATKPEWWLDKHRFRFVGSLPRLQHRIPQCFSGRKEDQTRGCVSSITFIHMRFGCFGSTWGFLHIPPKRYISGDYSAPLSMS